MPSPIQSSTTTKQNKIRAKTKPKSTTKPNKIQSSTKPNKLQSTTRSNEIKSRITNHAYHNHPDLRCGDDFVCYSYDIFVEGYCTQIDSSCACLSIKNGTFCR